MWGPVKYLGFSFVLGRLHRNLMNFRSRQYEIGVIDQIRTVEYTKSSIFQT